MYHLIILGAAAAYTIVFFHLIPLRQRVSKWFVYLDPLMAISFLFLLLSLSQGLSGEVFYALIIILIVAALAENGDILFPVAAYLAILHTMAIFFDPKMAQSFQEHPTTFISRYVTIFLVAYLGRYLSKQAWQQRLAREKLEDITKLKNEFILISSHSLRTPVTAVRSYLQTLLHKREKYDKEDQETLTNMDVSVEKLLTLTDELIEIASFEEKRVLIRSDFDLKEMVESLVLEFSPQAKSEKISITADIEEGISTINADERRIRSVLMHLLSNAIKFNKKGGTVKLKATKLDESLKISVSDTGIGVSKAEQSKIFNKFYRVGTTLEYNYEGEGIGLYLVKLIIEAHKGKIWVESIPGKGSTFTLTLPTKQSSYRS
jgi:signal transduction histidine kinase